MRAVLDTSVLLSAERRPLLFFASTRLFTIVLSDFILDELQRKMREIGWNRENATRFVAALTAIAEHVDHRKIEGGNYEVWLLDPDDHPIMATALAGKADYVVTWNTKHFPPKKRFAGVTVITPDAFLRELGDGLPS